jgi:hypothetical protein
VFWNAYRYEPEVSAALADVYGRIAPELLVDSVALGTHSPRDSQHDLAALKASELFDAAELLLFEHEREQSIAEWLEELHTHSVHQHVDPGRAQRIFAELGRALEAASGGSIAVRYETVVATGLRG